MDGYKILVTDDEPDFVTFVSTVLEDHGATILQAFSGDEAMEIARKENPNLITLDISMPGKSGHEVFEEIRLDDALKSIPVCIITGRPELRRFIYDRPVPPPEGYLDKPVTEDKLLMNVKKIIELAHPN